MATALMAGAMSATWGAALVALATGVAALGATAASEAISASPATRRSLRPVASEPNRRRVPQSTPCRESCREVLIRGRRIGKADPWRNARGRSARGGHLHECDRFTSETLFSAASCNSLYFRHTAHMKIL